MAVNLEKGQRISLEKEGGKGLSRVIMGLSWDSPTYPGFLGFGDTPSGAVDLDASCVLFDNDGKKKDVVWYRQLKSKDGSIRHTGDSMSGEGDGDDEQIVVDLLQVPESIKTLIFTVNSFKGHDFSTVKNAKCRLVNGINGWEIASYNLSTMGSHTGQLMCRVYRHNGEWKMHAIGDINNGKTFEDLLPLMEQYV